MSLFFISSLNYFATLEFMWHFLKDFSFCLLRFGSKKLDFKVWICRFIKIVLCVNSFLFVFILPEMIGCLSLFWVELTAGAAVMGLVCWSFMYRESMFDKVNGFEFMWAVVCSLVIYFPDILCDSYLLCLNSNFPWQLFRDFQRFFVKKTFVGMFR